MTNHDNAYAAGSGMEESLGRYVAILGRDDMAEHVFGDKPAWLFAADGEAILWANAAGLAFLDIRGLAALSRYRLPSSSPVARRLQQLTSRSGGASGLERFRFFVGMRARMAACQCQSVALDDGSTGILAIAVDAGSSSKDPAQAQFDLLAKAGLDAALVDGSDAVTEATPGFEALGLIEDGQLRALSDDAIVSAQHDNARLVVITDADAPAQVTAPHADDTSEADADDVAEAGEDDAGEQTSIDTGKAVAAAAAGSIIISVPQRVTADETEQTDELSASASDPSETLTESDEPEVADASSGAVPVSQDPAPEPAAMESETTDDALRSDDGAEGEELVSSADQIPEDHADSDAQNSETALETDAEPQTDLTTEPEDSAPAIEAEDLPQTGEAETEAAKASASSDENSVDTDDDEQSSEDETPGTFSDAIDRLAVPLFADTEWGDASDDAETDNAEAIEPEPTSEADKPLVEQSEEDQAEPISTFAFVPKSTPSRFVWEMDADRRFSMVSEEFAGSVGPLAADIIGKDWTGVASQFGIDNPEISRAAAAGETWTGKRVQWPVEATDKEIPVELTALPIYDHGRTFSGYRGFGVCRTDQVRTDPAGRGLGIAKASISREAGNGLAAAGAAKLADDDDERDHADTLIDAIASEEEQAAPAAVPSGVATMASAAIAGVAARMFSSESILGLFAGSPVSDAERKAFEVDPASLPAIPLAQATMQEDRSPAEDEPETGDFEKDIDASGTEETAAETGQDRAGAEREPESNVVPLIPAARGARPGDEQLKKLSRPEREAFQQIAEALGARIEDSEGETIADGERTADSDVEKPVEPAKPETAKSVPEDSPVVVLPSAFAPRNPGIEAGPVLDHVPIAVLVCRDGDVLFANKSALALLAYPDLSTLQDAGGLKAVFGDDSIPDETGDAADGGRPVTVRMRSGEAIAVSAQLYSVPWNARRALMMVLDDRSDDGDAIVALQSTDDRVEELEDILDTATDGVLLLQRDGSILNVNRSAEALFGADSEAMIGANLTDFLAPESHRSALDYIDGLGRNGVESVLNDGREVIGQEASGGLIPIFMTIGRIDKHDNVAKFCAVLRDITQWKKAEEELTSARRHAETASSQKSDFLAKISHEIRTPLNAIIGFSEVMLGERLGPIGTERYKEYLNDIRSSGDYIMSLINDLLDLSKIEAGKMDLTFEAVSVNDIVQNCVALLQPEANRERIIIRNSLSTSVPNVVADARSVQQIVLNLVSNAIKFNKRGGQVIVSTVYTDAGDVCVRVRDTGVGMSDDEVRLALEPFRQVQTTKGNTAGTGLGLPLTKALVEANRANFMIDSKPEEGTLVEIVFPSPRVLAE